MSDNGTTTDLAPTTALFTGEPLAEVLDVTSLGKGIVLTAARKRQFNHSLAKEYLEMNAVEWERNLRNPHVEFIIGEMRRGTFRAELASLASAQCNEDRKRYRINGQHTCWAVTEIPEKELPEMSIMTLDYQVKTVQDMRILYAAFDRGAPRTRQNILASYLFGLPQFTGISRNIVTGVITGMGLWLYESVEERRRHPPDELAFLAQRDHADLVNRVMAFCEKDPSVKNIDWMRRAGVYAAMLATFSAVHQPSVDFWTPIKTGTGFTDEDDARLRLRTTLMTSTLNSKAKATGHKTDSEELYRMCITAWNTWRAGGTVKCLRPGHKRKAAK